MKRERHEQTFGFFRFNIHLSLILICLFIYAVFDSCKEHRQTSPKQDSSIQVFKGTRVAPLMDSLLNEYRKAIPNAPAYAICIDKKSEGLSDYVITIAPFSKKMNNLYESGAANYFMLNDSIPIILYSGLEDFLVCDSTICIEAKNKSSKSKGEFKDIDNFKRFIDFSKDVSYIHYDTSTFMLKGNEQPFIVLRQLPPQVFFDTTSLKKHR